MKLLPVATDGKEEHGLNKFKIAIPAKIPPKNCYVYCFLIKGV